MSLRARIGLLTALAVGTTVLLACAVTYVAVRHELRSQIDDALTTQARLARQAAALRPRLDFPPPRPVPTSVPLPPASQGAPTAVQILPASGPVIRNPSSQIVIPVTAADRRVARGAPAFLSDRRVGSTHLRVYTFAVSDGTGVQIARSLNQTDDLLSRLRLILAALLTAAVIVGGLLGRLFSGRALRPVAQLTDAVEHVELTGDLSPRIPATDGSSRDEVGRLAERFNAMLVRLDLSRSALNEALDAQRRLVADASHELRTPVTSLRTNAEVLRADPELPAEQRNAILDDIDAQSEELGALVGDLIELARDGGGEPAPVDDDLRLDHLVEAVITRVRRDRPAAAITFTGEPVVIRGDRERIARAVGNLLDNAVKYAGADGPVEVAVTAPGTVSVRDHGPGIPDEELPRVFDRFWRGAASRDVHGSGLGLAIVRQVAEDHHGRVEAENAEGGGARLRLQL